MTRKLVLFSVREPRNPAGFHTTRWSRLRGALSMQRRARDGAERRPCALAWNQRLCLHTSTRVEEEACTRVTAPSTWSCRASLPCYLMKEVQTAPARLGRRGANEHPAGAPAETTLTQVGRETSFMNNHSPEARLPLFFCFYSFSLGLISRCRLGCINETTLGSVGV